MNEGGGAVLSDVLIIDDKLPDHAFDESKVFGS
jgi:hypothetical protein